MHSRSIPTTPEPIAQLQRRLDQFRNANPPRTKLPESIWVSATGLAKEYGIWATAKVLRLDYMGLKNRLVELAPPRRKPKKTEFVEMIAPHPPVVPAECVIEFESARGAKMRIQWKAAAPPDWAGLLHAWREVDG